MCNAVIGYCFACTEVVAEYAAVYSEYAAVLVNIGVTLCC